MTGSDDQSPAVVPQVAPSCDPSTLSFSPEEGFLFSRIDGHTPWRLLREMGGMTPEEVDMCLEGWLSRGILVAHAEAPRRESTQLLPSKPVRRTPGEIDEGLLDESLDIAVEVQRRILDMESQLDSGYYEFLGVERDSDARAIKKAYFKISKEFHPDRYFRRQVGSYAGRLDAIFKKAMEAYELLSDPTTRAEVEKTLASAFSPRPEPSNSASTARAGSASDADESQRRSAPTTEARTPLERLQQRMPFRIPRSVPPERLEKAAELFDAAQHAERLQNYLEAANNVRLAMAFNPFEPVYKERLADLRMRAAEQRASELLGADDSGKNLDHRELKEVMRLYEQTLLYRPHDPELNHKIACLALELDCVERARECIEVALEHSPEVSTYHTARARIHKHDGERGHAVKELECALALDPSDEEAKNLLGMLKKRRPSGARRVL